METHHDPSRVDLDQYKMLGVVLNSIVSLYRFIIHNSEELPLIEILWSLT